MADGLSGYRQTESCVGMSGFARVSFGDKDMIANLMTGALPIWAVAATRDHIFGRADQGLARRRPDREPVDGVRCGAVLFASRQGGPQWLPRANETGAEGGVLRKSGPACSHRSVSKLPGHLSSGPTGPGLSPPGRSLRRSAQLVRGCARQSPRVIAPPPFFGWQSRSVAAAGSSVPELDLLPTP